MDEAVSLSCDVDDVTHSVRAVSQGFPEGRDLRTQAALVDAHPSPDLGYEFVLGHHLTGIPDQQDKDVEGPGSQPNGRSLPGKAPFGGEQPERPELGECRRRRPSLLPGA